MAAVDEGEIPDDLSDAVPLELMQAYEGRQNANGSVPHVDLGTVYEVDIGALDSHAGSLGRRRFSAVSMYENVRRKLPGRRGSVQRRGPPPDNVSLAGVFRSEPPTTEASLQSLNMFQRLKRRLFDYLVPNDDNNQNVNPRYKEKGYYEKSYFEHWRNYFWYGINDGGALCPWVIIFLFAPGMLSSIFSTTCFGICYLLNIFGWLYIFMGFPELIGFAFAQGLRRLGPLHMYPFDVGAISITPFIHNFKIYVRLVVLDGKFGNPPGFPFPYFLECGRLDMEASFHFSDLLRLVMMQKKSSPLSRVPDFKYFIKFDFNHVEVSDAMVNFQMYDGRFNINEFTRLLAEGEAKHVLGKDPFPNQLHVSIFRGKGLKPHRLKRSVDPYVVVRVRRNVKQTATQTETFNPMFNEKLVFNLDDPSVVMEIAVYDRDSPDGSQAAFIGHWAMTTKYLICNPEFNFHVKEDFTSYAHKGVNQLDVSKLNPFKRDNTRDESFDYDDDTEQNYVESDDDSVNGPQASYKQLGFRGWIPLAAKNWEQMGERGHLEVKVVWKHVPKKLLRRDPFVEKRKFTALDQLSQQSAEDQLRFGAWSRVRHWLDHEPFCYDIKRFTVRRTKFYLQDLFRGYKGKPEQKMKKMMKGSNSKNKRGRGRSPSVLRRRRNREESRAPTVLDDAENEEPEQNVEVEGEEPANDDNVTDEQSRQRFSQVEMSLDGEMEEAMKNIQVDKETSGYVPILFMEMTERFRPKKGDIGVTSYHVFFNFFLGLVYEFARKGKTGRAVAQILSGGLFNIRHSIANVVKGESMPVTVQGVKETMDKIYKQTSAGFQVLHQKVTTNRLNAAQFRFPVDAYDTDFLLGPDHVEISGYLDRAPFKVKGQITKEKMIKLTKGSTSWNLKFKTKYFELKGETIFFRRHESFSEGKVYHLTYKLSLFDIQSVLYLGSKQELILNVDMHHHCVVLRIPKNPPGRTRSLQKWLSVLVEHGIPCVEED